MTFTVSCTLDGKTVPAKYWDRDEMTLHCSSFSKCWFQFSYRLGRRWPTWPYSATAADGTPYPPVRRCNWRWWIRSPNATTRIYAGCGQLAERKTAGWPASATVFTRRGQIQRQRLFRGLSCPPVSMLANSALCYGITSVLRRVR